MNLKTSNDHNVYILGAGFSATAGLPLMASFLNRMRDALEAFQKEGRSSECKAIGEVLDYRLKAASAAYWSTLDLENVEQLFSLAYAARHPVRESLPIAMAATLDFCRAQSSDRKVCVQLSDSDTSRRLRPPSGASDANWIENAPAIFRQIEAAETEGLTTSHVAALLGMVNSKSLVTGTNTVITFNYDTLFEDALTRLSVPWTYGFPPRATSGFFKDVSFEQEDNDDWGRSGDANAIPVLKLHGSVNWTVEQDEQLKIFRSYDALRDQLKQPRLIPPTWSKSVDDHLSLPWEKAIERLQTATRVIIIGFSMPETDLHFRYLLAAGLQENAWLRTIVFVNPDAAGVEARARAVLRNNYIDQGLIRFVPLSSDRFAAALLGHGRIATPDISVDIGRYPEGQLGFWTPSVRR
jgi:hypothetical protein